MSVEGDDSGLGAASPAGSRSGVPGGEFAEYFCVLDSQCHLQFIIIIIIKILIYTFLYGREVVSSEVCKMVEICY